MKKSSINDALRIARQRKADGGKTVYLFQDPAGYFVKKGEQVVDTARNLPQAWENYKNHPVVTAFREEPAEMFSSAGKMFGNWVAENPFAATRKAVDLATDLSMNPYVMTAKGILSSDPANAGEDEFARQVQYGIRPAPEAEALQYANGGRTGYGGGGYPTMQIDPVTGQPRLVGLDGGGENGQADTPSLGGISSSTSTGPSAAAPAGSPTASIGVADPNSMSPTTAATLASLQQEEAQAPAAANPYGSLSGTTQGPPAPAANPYGSLAEITQGPPAPTAPQEQAPVAPTAPNPYGGLTGITQSPPAPAPSSTLGVQAPQFSTPSFARADQLEDNPSITGATGVGQSVSNASYGALAEQNAQESNLMDAIDAGLDAPSNDAISDAGPDAGPEGGPDGGPEGGNEGGEGGDGGGGDGGGGGEKRGGLVRAKRRASGGMVDQALKIANIHNRKSKSQAKKDGSVVKQAVVLASKLAKRQRGRP